MNDDITCPYCGHNYSDEYIDLSDMSHRNQLSEECPVCGKAFIVHVDFSTHYFSEKIKQLEGEK